MDAKKKSGLYLHIPFCRHKCLYCDFFSAGEKLLDADTFSSALIAELKERSHELPEAPSTIYIGGGTPSLLPTSAIGNLIDSIREVYPETNPEEVTMEVNPEDVTPENADEWEKAGINRISMGIQSLNDAELKACGRRHTALQAIEAMNILKSYFNNISVDLIFGLPGQTERSWNETIEKTLSLQPTHLSAYSMMLEEGTAMTVLAEKARITLPDEEDSARMFSLLSDKMKENGFSRYEISNYALPGYESRHNSRYWSGAPYLGLGPAAHSYDGFRTRRWNAKNLKAYLDRFSPTAHLSKSHSSFYPFYEEEKLTDEELREEFVLTRMRTAAGIDLKEYEYVFGEEALRKLLKNARRDIEGGRLMKENHNLRLTDMGIMTADDVIVNLL